MKIINLAKTVGFPQNQDGGKLYLVKEDGHLNMEFKGSLCPRPMRARRTVLLKGSPSIPRSYQGLPYTASYVIDNYDFKTSYSGSITDGSVTFSGKTVNITTPVAGDRVYLTINNEVSLILLRSAKVNAPSAIYPVQNGTNIPASATFSISVYSPEVPGEPGLSTDWAIATDAAFLSVVKSGTLAGAVSNIDVNGLSLATTYYFRARHTGTYSGSSDWSATRVFTTASTEVSGAEQAKLLASDGAANDNLGDSAEISGDGYTAVIGASGDYITGTSNGSAYVFTRSGSSWTQQAKLTPSDQAAFDYTGTSVAISYDGNTVAVGSTGQDGRVADSGAVYIFTRSGSTWTQQAKVAAIDGAASDYLGGSVSLSADGKTLLVGAYLADAAGSNSGAAYVFVLINGYWMQKAKLVAPDGAAGDCYGYVVKVSADGKTAAITAVYRQDIGFQSGAVYVYGFSDGGSWDLQAKLLTNDGASGDRFGRYISLSSDGSMLLAGAGGSSINGANSGAVYFFTRTNGVWAQKTKFAPNDGAAGDQFGIALAMTPDGRVAVIASRYRDDKGTDSGSVYIYTRLGDSWMKKTKFSGSDSSSSGQFGSAVSIRDDGGMVLVGSVFNSSKGTYSGSAYIFI